MPSPRISLRSRSGVFPRTITMCIVGVLIAACSSHELAPHADHQPSEGSMPPPPVSETPSPADAAKKQAKAAYLGMWDAMGQAGETSDWRSPELGRFATGNALTTITRSLYTDSFNRVVTQGRPKNSPQVVSVKSPAAPETVMLSDCGDSTGTSKIREGTGKPVASDEPGGRRSIVAEVKKQPDGAWRVQRFAVQGVGSC